jgi:NitT/TauT family transport system substrate-binding protein
MRTFRMTTAAVAAASLLLTACGGSDGDAETSADDATTEAGAATDEDVEGGEDPASDEDDQAAGGTGELETTEVGYVVFSSGVPSRHTLAAEAMGYFEEAGLDVEIVEAGSPGDIMPLLASGAAHFAYLGYESGFNAANGGIDLVMLRELQQNVEEGQQLWANPQSGIESVADLEGASIAVAGVGGLADLLLAETLATEGLSLDDVNLVEIPPPATIPALLEGQVDAGWLPGPFAAAMLVEDEPPLTLVQDFDDVPALEGLGLAPLWAMRDWVEEHPNTAKAFVEVLDRVAAEFEEDPELDREQLALIVPEMDAEIIERHVLYPYTGEVPVDRVEDTQERFLEYGITAEPVDVADMVVDLG